MHLPTLPGSGEARVGSIPVNGASGALPGGPGRRAGAALLGAVAALSALACMSPARPDAMTPAPLGLAPRQVHTVNIRTTGGQATIPGGLSKISNDAFTEAIAQGLLESGLLHAVIDVPGDYQLGVDIIELRQPRWAFPMSVRLMTTWHLTPRGEQQPVWRDVITTNYTVGFGAEFLGYKRLGMATEGAARENITQAILRLSEQVE